MNHLLKVVSVGAVLFTSFAIQANAGEANPKLKPEQAKQEKQVQSPAQKELHQMIADNKGQVIYLDFWASWCAPCRKSFPWLNEMQAKYESQGLKVISVNLDAEREFADEFLQEIPADFAVVYDDIGATAKEFKVRGMPSSYLINRKGELVSRHVGFKIKKQPVYEQEIKDLLAK